MTLIEPYLAQTATYEPHVSNTTDGEPVFGAGQVLAVRFVASEVLVRDAHGPVRVGDGRLWLGPAPAVRALDRFTVGGTRFTVERVDRPLDMSGGATHQACVLRRV